MTYVKGQRVQMKFGWGTVVGFETFTPAGKPGPIVDEDYDNKCRVVVALDDPKQWSLATEKWPHPFMLRSDLEPK